MADSVVLQFFNGDTTGARFLTTEPGTSFVRTVNFDIGTGGNVYDYNGTSNRSAIYNAHDDKMYFLSHKSAPVEGDFLVQFDPRAMTVSNEMELPVGWIVDDTFVTLLLDCTDERAWILNQTDGTVRAFDTVSMTQVFTDGGAFFLPPYSDHPYSLISCGNGVVLLRDEMDTMITHRVTITGPTTFTDTTIAHADFIFWSTVFDNGMGSYQRLWNQSLNRVVVVYEGGFGGELIDVAAATATPFNFNATWTGSNFIVNDLEDYSIWWDVFSGTDRIVFAANLNGVYGMAIFGADGVQQGVCCRGQATWDMSSPAMPLGNNLVWSVHIAGDALNAGGFSLLEADPSTGDDLPAELYPSEVGDAFFTASTQICIAPGTATPEPPAVPPRLETSIGGGGSCGVQFERLEMFHLIKSLMGGGRTLEQAMKFLEEEDVDFLEEEGYMDDLPQEIPKPARQGTSPKMIERRINLAPITKLNSLIAEFETKLQNCRTVQRREYDK